MDEEINRLIEHLRSIEDQIERKFEQQRAALQYRIENKKIVFAKDVLEQQRRFRVGLIAYLRSSSLSQLLCMPFVYGLIAPLALLDIGVWFYQRVCFSLWGLPRVERAAYVVFDRHQLVYLNGLQKLNCMYCGYANGVIALAREVASQTEQYWCPIKHAVRLRNRHDRYQNFLEYGDAEGFQRKSEDYRRQLLEATETGR